jgi:hypothetical protein
MVCTKMKSRYPVTISAQDLAEGLQSWVKEEFKQGPLRQYDLAKFFFTVSSGTIGLIVSVEKLSSSLSVKWYLVTSLVGLFLSIIVSLLMALPKSKKIGFETDIQKYHKNRLIKMENYSGVWFVMWFFSVLVWIIPQMG